MVFNKIKAGRKEHVGLVMNRGFVTYSTWANTPVDWLRIVIPSPILPLEYQMPRVWPEHAHRMHPSNTEPQALGVGSTRFTRDTYNSITVAS